MLAVNEAGLQFLQSAIAKRHYAVATLDQPPRSMPAEQSRLPVALSQRRQDAIRAQAAFCAVVATDCSGYEGARGGLVPDGTR